MSSWLEFQKNLVEAYDFIAEIDVETITLTRMGNYKTTPYSLKQNLFSLPTAKSLKGVWRWWARTAIVGAYNGRVNYKKANEHLNRILGGIGKDEGISLFRLEISDVRFPKDSDANLMKIINEIDKYYEKAKEFLILQEPQLSLPKNTKVSVTLNPSISGISIENQKILLHPYEMKLGELIKDGPLGNYFVTSKKAKKGHKINISLKIPIPNLNDYLKIPRIRLLLMKRGNEEDVLDKNNIDSEKIIKYLERLKEEMSILVSTGLKFKILLYGSKEAEKVNFALSSLILSLILGGVGSMTKRAFGSLKLISFRFRHDLKISQEVQEVFQELQNKDFTKDELKNTLEKLCNITINYAKRVFNISKVQEFRGTPIVPSLSNIRIETIECSYPNLAKIGNAFLKQKWKQRLMVQGRDLHTWILGLPRFQEETGYAKIKHNHKTYEPLRRISSIGARCFKTPHKNFIIVFGFLSDDWPMDLWHIRRKGQPEREKLVRDITIGSSLQSVFDQAFKEVLKRVCER